MVEDQEKALRLSGKQGNFLPSHGLTSNGLGEPWRFPGSWAGLVWDMVVRGPSEP